MREQSKVLDAWNRERNLFPRNKEGNLIAKKVPILGLPEKCIMMIPKTIGETNEIRSNLETGKLDSYGLKKVFFDDCLISPRVNELNCMRPQFAKLVYYTLLFESGYDINIEHIKSRARYNSKKKDKSSAKVKIYKLIKEDLDKAKYDFLLHELGYTFMEIPKLTRGEADLLLISSVEIERKRNGKGSKPGYSGK